MLLVVRYKVMTMTEFYNADVFDIDLAASHLDQAERDASERMRNLMWAVLAPNSKTKLTPEDVLTFSWERDDNEPPKPTTREQFEEAFKDFLKPKQKE